MAENTTVKDAAGATVTIASDEVTINSVAVQVQRMKMGWGADGSYSDTSSAAPLPVAVNDGDIVSTGTITVTDSAVGAPAGTGAFVTGTSTASSYVTIACPGGDSAWMVQITGLTSGTLYFEGSVDSTNGIDGNWINVNGRQTGIVNTILSGNSTTNGLYRGNTSGLKYFRVRAVGALTGTPSIVIRISGGIGAIFLNASIPAGSNTIGNTGLLHTSPSATVGSITTTTSTITATGLAPYSNVTIGIYGTYVGVTAVFEISHDGTNWFPIQGVRTDSFTAESGPTALASTARAWDVPIMGLAQFRVRATAWTSGTANILIVPTTATIDPSPTVGLTPTANAITQNGLNSIVGSDLTWTWAASIGAAVTATGTGASDITLPTLTQPDSLYTLTVYNPSTVSAVTISVQNKETFSATARYGELTSLNVPANSTRSFILQGFFMGEASRLIASNDTALAAGQGFSAVGRIRKV